MTDGANERLFRTGADDAAAPGADPGAETLPGGQVGELAPPDGTTPEVVRPATVGAAAEAGGDGPGTEWVGGSGPATGYDPRPEGPVVDADAKDDGEESKAGLGADGDAGSNPDVASGDPGAPVAPTTQPPAADVPGSRTLPARTPSAAATAEWPAPGRPPQWDEEQAGILAARQRLTDAAPPVADPAAEESGEPPKETESAPAVSGLPVALHASGSAADPAEGPAEPPSTPGDSSPSGGHRSPWHRIVLPTADGVEAVGHRVNSHRKRRLIAGVATLAALSIVACATVGAALWSLNKKDRDADPKDIQGGRTPSSAPLTPTPSPSPGGSGAGGETDGGTGGGSENGNGGEEPEPSVGLTPDQIDQPSQYTGARYPWGDAENRVGAEQATKELKRKIALAIRHGATVETSTNANGTWRIDRIVYTAVDGSEQEVTETSDIVDTLDDYDEIARRAQQTASAAA